MIELWEQYGYKAENSPEDFINPSFLPTQKKEGTRFFNRKEDNGLCFKFWRVDNQEQFRFQTSYFVGVDWIEDGKSIYVAPKKNNGEREINYLKMLMDAFQEEVNVKHLDNLFEVDFDKPFISIEQSQDLLTPLLVYQYLKLLKAIVRKGLRKSYYKVDRNLNARVKGKVLINQTIKQNLVKSKTTSTLCRFEEFGINSLENKVLKKAFEFSKSVLSSINADFQKSSLPFSSFIEPAFHLVDSEVNILELKYIRPNPLFPEYEHALKLAKIILRKYGFSISKTTESRVETPPFWIDMSKLFELYVLSKLRHTFTLPEELIYHPKINGLEPDFLIRSRDKEFSMVVDAKYKPRYKDGSIDIDDIRQVSAYARMKGVYERLGVSDYNKVIECLIIYSDQEISLTELDRDNLKENPISSYVHFYKTALSLPEIKH
jgi:5-methylcytosine-specific restriction enzyme subunit McrC